MSLLTAMLTAGVKHLVFSSTAAVYGNPHTTPILESFPIQAVNPYGESKVMVETLLRWFDEIHHVTSVCLRYFNAAGADPEGVLGEEHEPETHLIPLLLRAVKTGQPLTVFGGDYPTPDGTCIRDYIHVNDLAQAHILALEHLISGGASDREPSWSFDGSYIVFTSDRSGKLDIWRLTIGADRKPGVPERLTRNWQPDGQPVVAQDGRILFTRGRGAAAQLWLRSAAGVETRLTANRATERSAVVSPDGSRVVLSRSARTSGCSAARRSSP